MTQIVSGRFASQAEAEEAVHDLAEMGVRFEAIRFIPTQIAHGKPGARSTSDIVIGVIFGALLGASVGALAGVIFLSLPVLGPLLAGFMLSFGLTSNLAGMVAGTVIGGLLGAYLGAVTWAGVAETAFGALVTARVDESAHDRAAEIMRRHGALGAR